MKKNIVFALLALALTACSKSSDAQEINLGKPLQPEQPIESKGIIYQWDFDDPNPLHDLIEVTENTKVAVDPFNGNNKTLRFTLPAGSYRSEVSMGNTITGRPHFFDANSPDTATGEEIWVGFRVLVRAKDYKGHNIWSVAQIGPLYNPTLYPGERSKGHMQLIYEVDKTRWRWREYKSIFNPNEYAGAICPSETGQWERFVMHARIRSDDKGLIEVWRNGVLVYQSLRQNAIEGDKTRVKWGIYIGQGNLVEQAGVCYFDDIKIGGCESSYNDVAPR